MDPKRNGAGERFSKLRPALKNISSSAIKAKIRHAGLSGREASGNNPDAFRPASNCDEVAMGKDVRGRP
jgi:hypothetical protein